jgi:threonine/homoserine/homoserine lactone efflux protein|tara:strand:+ start:855 stop:1394 length:540 start_codon:yes stop_codon:yes gene_type:complete
MASGVNFGVRPSLPHVLGICLGFPVMVISLGIGLGALFDSVPILHEIIKIFGVAYLLYLAWLVASSSSFEETSSPSRPLRFDQAVLFQWVNPKAWVMATGAISTYTTTAGDTLTQVLFIAFAFFITAAPSVMIWLIFGAGLKRYLDNALHNRIFNIVMALLLVVSMSPVINGLIQQYLN